MGSIQGGNRETYPFICVSDQGADLPLPFHSYCPSVIRHQTSVICQSLLHVNLCFFYSMNYHLFHSISFSNFFISKDSTGLPILRKWQRRAGSVELSLGSS